MDNYNCTLENNHISVALNIKQKETVKLYPLGIYNILNSNICNKCGNPYIFEFEDRIECFESLSAQELKRC